MITGGAQRWGPYVLFFRSPPQIFCQIWKNLEDFVEGLSLGPLLNIHSCTKSTYTAQRERDFGVISPLFWYLRATMISFTNRVRLLCLLFLKIPPIPFFIAFNENPQSYQGEKTPTPQDRCLSIKILSSLLSLWILVSVRRGKACFRDNFVYHMRVRYEFKGSSLFAIIEPSKVSLFS